ncbi:MAG: bifunctional riboflavin kinase/FAD synthetase [Candidatus Eutrophobiaceae bacterium]
MGACWESAVASGLGCRGLFCRYGISGLAASAYEHEFVRGFRIRCGSLHSAPLASAHPCVVTIGNFDGVHLGHQAIIRRLRTVAQTHDVPAAAIFFEPQPREFFSLPDRTQRISALRDKLSLLQEYGLNEAICLRFDSQLSNMGAADFIERILAKLRLRHVLVGDDFRFGSKRSGDFHLLQNLCAARNISVQAMGAHCVDGLRVSSTAIRAAFQAGDLAGVNRLLGHPLRVSGRVEFGSGRGKALGFPTANIHTSRKQLPLHGIFAAHVWGVKGNTAWPAAAYWGSRPVYGGRTSMLEVHLLDFQEDLYGRRLRVDFLHRVRGDRDFPNESALRAQMHADVHSIRACFQDDLNKPS